MKENPQKRKIKSEHSITSGEQMKEEISLELADLGNRLPKQEPMTPNAREKSEREKWYN